MASMFFAYNEEVFQPLLYYTSEVDLEENVKEVRNKLQTWNIVTATRTMRLRKELYYLTGADPGFFLGGGALVSCSTSTPINHIVFFFCRIPVVLENRRSSRGGGVGAHPLHPPPRSASALPHSDPDHP